MKTFKAVVLFFTLLLVFVTPFTIYADDERSGGDGEWTGIITSRPEGKTGTWTIGGRDFSASRRTELDTENGPLVVDACAKVKYERRDGVDVARKIKREEAEKCGTSGDGGGGDNGGGTPPPDTPGDYIVIGWNDLGMHCMDPSYEDFAVLPPYNTLWAQVIRRGDEPDIVTSGVTVEYSFPDNTDSTTKTNL